MISKKHLLIGIPLFVLMNSGCSSKGYSVPEQEPENINPVHIQKMEGLTLSETNLPQLRKSADRSLFSEFKEMEPSMESPKIKSSGNGASSKSGRFNNLIKEYKKKVSY
jgi:hypothetical protein